METERDFSNSLLKRRELIVSFEHQSNPGFAKTSELLASAFKVPADTIVIKSIQSRYGSAIFVVTAFVYATVADKERVERIKAAAPAAGSA